MTSTTDFSPIFQKDRSPMSQIVQLTGYDPPSVKSVKCILHNEYLNGIECGMNMRVMLGMRPEPS